MRNPFVNPLLMFFPKKMLGIDIGTASIKIAEISRWGGGKTLENYGEIKSMSLYKEEGSFRTYEKGGYLLSDYFISKAIRAVLDEAKTRTKAAIFSVPDFSTFCTSFEIPPMSEKEIPQAVYYNASQYIPLPITETTLDWRLLEGTPGDGKSPLKIFLVAIPNQIVQWYQRVAEMAGLELYAIEAEALGIARALVKDKKKTICLLDIGAQSTTINIIEKGKLRKSYSFNFAGASLTSAVSTSLNLDFTKAEEMKNNQGLASQDGNISRTLYLLIDPLLMEVKKILIDFSQSEQKNIDEVYLTGGTANLIGLKEYFAEALKMNVLVPNCFSDILYPPILDESLKKMSPSYSVAVGVALGGLETN